LAHHRYEANRHAIQATEEGDQEGQARAAAAQARAGLALLGLSAERSAPLDLGLAPGVRHNLTQAPYELVAIWADVLTLGPAPPVDRVKEALRILDCAPQLGVQTQSYHRRRARLLHLLDDKPAADREIELAKAQSLAVALDHFLLAQDL